MNARTQSSLRMWTIGLAAAIAAIGLTAHAALAQTLAPGDQPEQPRQPRIGQPLPTNPEDDDGHAHGLSTAKVGAAPGIGDQITFAGPGVLFDTPSYNFGRLQAGAPVRHDFWFHNPGTEPLVIENVKPGCGCTTAGSWDREILPGETGRIPISLSTQKFSGKVSKTINIQTNAKEAKTMILRIEGEVWQPVQLAPTSAVFGTLTGDLASKPMTKELTLTNNMDTPLEIKSVNSPNPVFRAEITPIEPGKKFKVIVTALPPIPSGSVTAQIKVATNLPQMPEVVVPASAYMPAPVQLRPQRLPLPPASPNAYERQVQIKNNTGKAITISDLKCTDPSVTVELVAPPETGVTPKAETARVATLSPGATSKLDYILKLKFPANYQAPPTGAQVTMRTDVQSAESLTVHMQPSAIRPRTPGAPLTPRIVQPTQPQGPTPEPTTPTKQ